MGKWHDQEAGPLRIHPKDELIFEIAAIIDGAVLDDEERPLMEVAETILDVAECSRFFSGHNS